MRTIFVEGNNPRPATTEEEIAIDILEAAIKRIQMCPVPEELVINTNNCDAMALAEKSVRESMQVCPR